MLRSMIMRRMSYLLHVYKNDEYIKAINFDSRTLLTKFLRSNGGIFGTDVLTDIGERLVTIPTSGKYIFEVEELFC